MTISQNSSFKLIPIDQVDAHFWLNQSRKKYLFDVVSPVFNHLVESKSIISFLEYWVDLELYNDILKEKNSISDIATDDEVNSTNTVTTQLDRINQCVLEWAYSHWANKLESLYLQNKSILDVISFRLLRVKNKNLSYELYLRLKEKECSFVDLSNQYGRVPEKNKGGLVSEQSLNAFPFEMQQLIGQIILKPQIWLSIQRDFSSLL